MLKAGGGRPVVVNRTVWAMVGDVASNDHLEEGEWMILNNFW